MSRAKNGCTDSQSVYPHQGVSLTETTDALRRKVIKRVVPGFVDLSLEQTILNRFSADFIIFGYQQTLHLYLTRKRSDTNLGLLHFSTFRGDVKVIQLKHRHGSMNISKPSFLCKTRIIAVMEMSWHFTVYHVRRYSKCGTWIAWWHPNDNSTSITVWYCH